MREVADKYYGKRIRVQWILCVDRLISDERMNIESEGCDFTFNQEMVEVTERRVSL